MSPASPLSRKPPEFADSIIEMSERIMQISTFEIHKGELEAFKDSVTKAVAFAEANGPQLLVEVYIDEGVIRAHSCQIQPDSEAVLAHWRLSDPYIRGVMESCTMQRLDMYGRPNDAVMEGLRPLLEQGITVTVTPDFVGFGRFRNEEASSA
ncbi:MAG TPA: hypothetical protein VFY87_05045 [Geminicoccaceae bacterium]|nr:hypothetical protein [Geminicoccaceae bacterium]